MAEEVAVLDTAPVEVPTVEIKLFKKWTTDDVNVTDISLTVSRCVVCVCGRGVCEGQLLYNHTVEERVIRYGCRPDN